MERIISNAIAGLAVRLAGAALAVYFGVEVAGYIGEVFGHSSAIVAALESAK